MKPSRNIPLKEKNQKLLQKNIRCPTVPEGFTQTDYFKEDAVVIKDIGVRYNKVHFIDYLNIFYNIYSNFRAHDPSVAYCLSDRCCGMSGSESSIQPRFYFCSSFIVPPEVVIAQ